MVTSLDVVVTGDGADFARSTGEVSEDSGSWTVSEDWIELGIRID